MRRVHRWVMVLSGLLMLYLAITGLMIQTVDLVALFRPNLPSSAPSLKSIKEYSAGPPYFSILSSVDEQGDGVDDNAARQWMASAFSEAQRMAPDQPVSSVQLRVVAGVPQAVVIVGRDATEGGNSGSRQLIFNAATAQLLADGPAAAAAQPDSTHDAIKDWHRGNIIGITGVWLNLWSGVALLVLCFTGAWLYLQMWSQRRRQGRVAFFWS